MVPTGYDICRVSVILRGYDSVVVAGDWQPHVPAATYGRPCTPDAIVPRSTVVRSLLRARPGDLVTVVAPAGYGKTTVVTQWDDADARPFAWARIDHLDDDATHLVLHIATAVDRVTPMDAAALRYLRGPGRAPLTHLVPALADALQACGPLVVVLDDVHELSAPDARAAVAALVDTAPPLVTTAVVGRGVPCLELARRRLSGKVIEIGVEQLMLTEDEAARAFVAVGGPRDTELLQMVCEKCEGWAAGVVLAAMATRAGADAAPLTGCHPLVADYLVEEVLDRLDDETTRFLVESVILDRFCAAALDDVLGRHDCAQRLESIRRSGNDFLIALDSQQVWYRYHALLRDLLRARLRSGNPTRFHELAARAADYLERQGDIDGAIVQAMAAGDRAHAAALVGRDAVRLGFDGRAGLLARRVGLLDERTRAEYPDAAIGAAWLGISTGDAELIQRSLMMAGRADRGLPLADGTPSVKVAAALVGSLIGVGGVHDVVRQAETVRAAGDSLFNPWWGAATVMKGAAEAMLGHNDRARTLLESALAVVGDLPGFHAAALAHLALLDLGDGDDVGCVERSAAARRIADTHDLCDVVPMVVVYAVSAVTAARVGDAMAARDAIATTDRLLADLGNLAARTALLGHGLLAWTAAVLGDRELTARHLQAGERARRREPQAVALTRRLDRVRVLSAGGRCKPLTAAELRLLPHLATHLSLRQIAEELVIGRETVKSQATSIYRKLAVASRADAVAEAKRVGLLAS